MTDNPQLTGLSSWHFHPNRYYRTRKFASNFIHSYRNICGKGAPSPDSFSRLVPEFTRLYNRALMDLAPSERPMDPKLPTKELSLAIHFARHYLNGRNIYHFNPDLQDVFLEYEDIYKLKFSDLALPAPVIYLSFGTYAGLMLFDGHTFDGAYVTRHGNGSLEILATTIDDDLNPPPDKGTLSKPDPYFYYGLRAEGKGELIEPAAVKAWDERRPGDLFDKEELFITVQALIAGALFDLTINGGRFISRYPDDSPEDILERLRVARGAVDTSRLIEQLAREGYTLIHFRELDDDEQGVEPAIPQPELRPDWDRESGIQMYLDRLLRENTQSAADYDKLTHFLSELRTSEGIDSLRSHLFRASKMIASTVSEEDLFAMIDGYIEDAAESGDKHFSERYDLGLQRHLAAKLWKTLLLEGIWGDYYELINHAYLILMLRIEAAVREEGIRAPYEADLYNTMRAMVKMNAEQVGREVIKMRRYRIEWPYSEEQSDLFNKLCSEISHEIFGLLLRADKGIDSILKGKGNDNPEMN